MNPLTSVYGAATSLRNAMFDLGVKSSRRLARPVISVGNISAGGSGKTPFVIALGELLKARGISFDVLSRGYRRKTRGVLVVEPDGNAVDFGDEPLLIARRLNVPVIVGESRYQAGQLAEQKFPSQLHVLDDGFQHRILFRDFDIVLVTEADFRDRLLPSGRLREPLSSLHRADAIVLPNDFPSTNKLIDDLKTRGKLIWRMDRQLTIPETVSSPIAFCGIARPQQFFDQVHAVGIKIAEQVEFRDHHSYTQHDIERLLALRKKLGANGFLTTEKDATNLGPLQHCLEPLAIAKLNITLDAPASIVDALLSQIAEQKPHS
jgi:tetraacyldisaccharide 4'-kinase